MGTNPITEQKAGMGQYSDKSGEKTDNTALGIWAYTTIQQNNSLPALSPTQTAATESLNAPTCNTRASEGNPPSTLPPSHSHPLFQFHTQRVKGREELPRRSGIWHKDAHNSLGTPTIKKKWRRVSLYPPTLFCKNQSAQQRVHPLRAFRQLNHMHGVCSHAVRHATSDRSNHKDQKSIPPPTPPKVI